MRNRICGIIAAVLVCLQMLLIVASWIITAAMPEVPMRSLLSSEGIRWLFGHFVDNLNSPILVNIILLMVGIGAVSFSGLSSAVHDFFTHKRLGYFERVGIVVVAFELVLCLLVVILLTCVPHAILLSATGHLFPSSFSISLIAIISTILLVCAISFGIISSRLSSLKQIYESMTYGLVRFVWIIPIYIFAMELFRSICFVFEV